VLLLLTLSLVVSELGLGSDLLAAQLRWRPKEGVAVPEVDPEIYLVLTGGCWGQGESQGRYRLVVIEGGFEELFHMAYVQLLQVDLEHGRERVAKTTPIAETEDRKYLVTLRDIRFTSSLTPECGDAVFEGTVVRRTHERVIGEKHFRLQVHPDGSYSWSEAPASAHTPQPSDASGSRKK
jgi:hypothetical protein